MDSQDNEVSMLDLTKLQLKINVRREKKTYDEIRNFTKNIVSSLDDINKEKVTQNLKQELELYRIIDYNVKVLIRKDSLADIISALDDVEERMECLMEQYNFISAIINHVEMHFLHPEQLLNLSYQRRRLFSIYISRNKYKPPFVTSGTITVDSDSESEEEPAPVKVKKQKYATNEAGHEKESVPQTVDNAVTSGTNIFQDDDDEADSSYYCPSRPPSPETAMEQDNERHSEDTSQSAIDPAFLAPGCSKWIMPFR